MEQREGSYLTSSPSSSMDRQIVHFSSVSNFSPSSCSALPSCGLLCSKFKDIILLGLDFLMLYQVLVVAGRQIIRASSISQIFQLGEASPAKTASGEEDATSTLLVHTPPPRTGGSGADGNAPRSSLSAAAPAQPHHLLSPPCCRDGPTVSFGGCFSCRLRNV